MDFNKVAIFYQSSDGGDWAMYLQSKLNTEYYSMETVLNDMIRDTSLHIRSARINVFLITPDFLESYFNWEYLEKFDKRTSFLILTGIDYCDVEQEAISRDRAYILDWTLHEMTGEEESVRDLMIQIIEMYEMYLDTPASPAVSDTDGQGDVLDYDVLPSRLSKQLNSVVDIIQKDDIVYVLLERQPEGRIAIHFPHDYIVPECLDKAAVYTFDSQGIDGTSFTVNQDEMKIGGGKVNKSNANSVNNVVATQFSNAFTQTSTDNDSLIDKSNKEDKTKPETIEEEHSETDSVNQSVTFEENEEVRDHISKRESLSNVSRLETLHQLLEDETDPEELLCKALKIKHDPGELDERLAEMISGLESLRKLSRPSILHTIDEPTHSVWPSLLHFGAQFNLRRFCCVLTGNQIVYNACAVRNKDGFLPHDLAEKYGHVELADMLSKIPTSERGRNDAKYDSGVDADSCRSSTFSEQDEANDPPMPVTHMSSAVGRNTDIKGDSTAMKLIAEEMVDDDEYLNESLSQQYKTLPLSKSLSEPYHQPEVLLPSPTKPQKKGFFKKFGQGKKQKQRRFSEPTVPTNVMEQLQKSRMDTLTKKKPPTVHRRNLPVGLPAEAPPMCMGATLKPPSKNTDGSKRQSARITNALNDKCLSAPKLPHRK